MICIDAISQDNIFEHLDTKDGISHVTINDIYQDELGMMWFATRDGLNRYNGNEIKVFRPEPDDANSIPAARISSVIGDNEGFLYLSISNKIIQFDIRKEKFRELTNKGAASLFKGKKGIFWSYNNKLFLFDKSKNKISIVFEHPQKNTTIRKICESKDGTYWLGTTDGLYSLSSDFKLKKQYLPEFNIRFLLVDNHQNLWVCSESKGVVKLESNGQTVTYSHDKNNQKSIISNNIRTACVDKMGYIWFGSNDGLCRLNTKSDEFENYLPQPENPTGLSFKSITTLYTDKQGTVWIGTYFGSINYINPTYQQFRYYHSQTTGLNFPVVGHFAEDKRGTIWLCTSGGFLSSFNPITQEFNFYNSKNNISSKYLKSIWYDGSKDCLWLGSSDYTLERFDIKTKKAKTFKSTFQNPSFNFGRRVNHIIPFNDQLLLATSGANLCLFDPNSGKIKTFLSQITGDITSLLIDSKRNLWIGANDVYCFNLKTQKIKRYKSSFGNESDISVNTSNVIFEDSKQNIWIGTDGFGLKRYRSKTDDFETFTEKNDGLLSNSIVALSESHSGLILIGTNSGLSTFNSKNESFSNYQYKSGFPLTAINEGSIFVSRKGDIYIGGITGMVIFKEENLRQIQQPFNIAFTKLYLNNKETKLLDETNVLTDALPFTKEITLQPEFSSFTIEFMTDNYIKGNDDDVQYRLKGDETKWIDASLGKLITYTNLSPGDYILEIRSKKFPEISKSLNIELKPPFYRTYAAYLFYLFIVGLIIYLFLRQSQMRIYLKSSLEFEKKEKEKNEELIQSKLAFFTNISHEIRTPVTLIIGQIESVLQIQNLNSIAYNKLLKIHKSSINLKGLISELLDFSKQEHGHLELKISEVSISTFLNEIFSTFQGFAASRNIDFEFTNPIDDIKVWIDTVQMQKVINNLLSNAFKNTPDNGKIWISISESDRNVDISVSDSGKGILEEDLNQIFERFYQSKSTSDFSGTGIGLALSKGIVEAHKGSISVKSIINEGSVFTITILKGDNHFDSNIPRIEIRNEISFYPEKKLDTSFVEEIKNSQEVAGIEHSSLLIVEDNDDLRDLLTDIFNPFYTVETTVDGVDALEKIKINPPDVIISDIMMPRMTGIELCIVLKSDFETCHIPIILLTAMTSVEHKFEGLKVGADDYITKPFEMRLLVSRCNNLVNSRKILQKKFIHQHDFPSQQLTTNFIDLEFINKATSLAEINIENEQFDVDVFASEMGMGRTSFFNKLKCLTGLTPLTFISNIKLKRAVDLLLNKPDMNIADIAYCLGYSSPRYFNECFKEIYGCPPLQYRKRYRIKK